MTVDVTFYFSVFKRNNITNYSSSWLRVPFQAVDLVHDYQSWDSTQSSASTSTMYQSPHVESRLYAVFKLLIFIEKFSPLPGFDPGTSPVPSRYATNWAILAWIWTTEVTNTFNCPDFWGNIESWFGRLCLFKEHEKMITACTWQTNYLGVGMSVCKCWGFAIWTLWRRFTTPMTYMLPFPLLIQC